MAAFNNRTPQLSNYSEYRLSLPVAVADTTITLASVVGFPTILTASDYVPMVIRDATTYREVIHVTAVDIATKTLTVVRGQEGSAARDWTTSAYLYTTLTAEAARDLMNNNWRRPKLSSGGNATPTRTGDTTFTLQEDHTGLYVVDCAVRIFENGALKAGSAYVVSSSYSAPTTTVTISGVTLTSGAVLNCVEVSQRPDEIPKNIFLAPAQAAATAAQAAQTAAESARDSAVSETQAIKDDAVSETQAIKDDAVSETQAIRNAASASAAQAAVYAANAASSAHFVGMWADLSGPLARPASVSHNGKLWLLTVDLANVALSEPGVSDDWFSPGGSVEHCTYNNRAILRSLAPSENALYIVDHLGLFRFAEGSDEPDDDETCFRTSAGAWVLDAPHFDVATAMLAPDELNQDERLDDVEARLDDAEANGSTLRASALCSITSINTLTQASFTASVPGAAVGDVSVACPAGALDPRVSVFARVTATDTVTVYINNPSASTATLTAGTWAIFVHKGA